MHLVVAGEVDFLKLRSIQSGIELGWNPNSYCEPQTESIHPTLLFTKSGENSGKDLEWRTIAFHKEKKNPQLLQTLHLQCTNSYLHLEALEVNNTFKLEILGSNNTVICSACDLDRLTLSVTGHGNRLSFDSTQPLKETSLSISGYRNFVENLWLLGCVLSTLSVRNESFLTMTIQQELYERQIKFTRDSSSSIAVTLPVEGQRNVQSLYELWSLDSTLLNIETQKTRKSDPPPFEPLNIIETPAQRTICIICITSIPDHLLQPCGHLCFCQPCYQELSARETNYSCPICRGEITSIQKVFTVLGY